MLTRLPWDLVPAAVSLVALRRLRSAGAFVKDANGLQRPSIWLLGFSILFVAGFGTFGARCCAGAYRWWRSRSVNASPATYLAARRLTAFPGPTFAVVALVTLCLGTSVESLLLVASMRATIDAKAGVFVGRSSDRAAMPAVVVGNVDVGAVTIEGQVFALDVVGRAEAFPAMSSDAPLVVVDRRWVAREPEAQRLLHDARARDEWWVRGDADEARAALGHVRYPPYLILTADEVKDIPSLAAMIDIFLVLEILGAAAALLALAGTMMYLQARQRAHLVSYALSLRMGMTARTHEGSLRRELTMMLGASFAIGTMLAVISLVIVAPVIDPLPTVSPPPLLVVPWMPFVLAGALAAAAAAGGGASRPGASDASNWVR